MKRVWVSVGVAIVLFAAGAALVDRWLRVGPPADLEERVATFGERPAAFEVSFPGEFLASSGEPADWTGDWPAFRGPNRDGISPEGVRLAREWPAAGPPVVWSIAVGEGYAGAAVHKGRVYLLDYDEKAKGDCLRCLSLADGREIWRRWYKVPIQPNHGISRTVPAVTDRYVVTLGPKCHVMCVDARTGDFRWALDLVREFGTQEPRWYAGQCPLVDGGRAILAPAGPEVLLMAVDCETGNVVWKTPNPRGWQMTHTSVVPAAVDGVRMYLYTASGGVTGVAAQDGDGFKAGDILWQHEWKVNFANCPSPVPLGDGRVFLTGGYGTGSLMLRLKREGGRFAAEEVLRLEAKGFSTEHHAPVYYGGYLYGIMAKEAGALGNQLVCLDPSGRLLWSSGRENRFGLGPFMVADGLILALEEKGTLVLAEASPKGYVPLAQANILEDGHEAWGPLALAGGRLILRDLTRMVCLDLRADRGGATSVASTGAAAEGGSHE